MHPSIGNNPTHILLAFWRRDTVQDCAEFFVPLHGYTKFLRHLIIGGIIQTARQAMRTNLGIDPRANARIFRLEEGCVVAFALSVSEARALPMQGAWLPASLIADPAVKPLLMVVAERL